MSNKNRQRQFYNNQEGYSKVEDQSQDSQEVTEQTTEQVVEQEVTEVAQQEPVQIQTPQVTVAKVQETAPVQETKPVKQEGFTPVFKVELELNNYAEAMDRKKAINPEVGGKWQFSLYQFIKTLLNSPNQEEFNKEWTTLLNFFAKNKDGIFNEQYLFRFPEHWPGSPVEYATFRRVLFTIIETTDPKTRRKAVTTLDLTKVTEGLTEAQKQRLFNFYGV